jgi:putative salt-induced outer membrane protein
MELYMTFQVQKIIALMLGLSLSIASYAAEDIIKVDKDYKLDATLSYLLNSTNDNDTTDTKQSFAGSIDYQQMLNANWGEEFKATAVNSSDKNDSANNVAQYLAFGKLTHSQGSFYEFGKLQWERDLTSAFADQTSLTFGLGRELYRDQIQFLTGELGAGVRYDTDREPPQDTKTEAIGTVAAHYERQLLPTTRFTQDLGFDYGSSSNTVRSHSALAIMMTDKLSGQLSFDYKKINSDLGGSTTTLTSVGLKYSY